MAKMTYKQIEHCRSRIATIRRQLVGETPYKSGEFDGDALIKRFQANGKGISPATMAATLERYNLQIQKDRQYGYSQDETWLECLAATIFAKDIAREEGRYEKERAVYDALCRKVDAEVTRVEDQILLGDQRDALDALENLENWKPGVLTDQ